LYLGLYLTDLIFTADGNPDTRNGGRLINFDKYLRMSRIIADVQRFQQPYSLLEIQEIQDYLQVQLETTNSKGANDLYRLSCILEPKDDGTHDEAQTDMDYKIRVLEGAGFL